MTQVGRKVGGPVAAGRQREGALCGFERARPSRSTKVMTDWSQVESRSRLARAESDASRLPIQRDASSKTSESRATCLAPGYRVKVLKSRRQRPVGAIDEPVSLSIPLNRRARRQAMQRCLRRAQSSIDDHRPTR